MTALMMAKPRDKRTLRGLLRDILFKAPQPQRWNAVGLAVAAFAYAVVIARATVLGYAFALPAALAFGPQVASGGPGRLYATLSFVVFEELARLGYAWDARNRTASLIAFCGFTLVVENLAYFNGAYGLGLYLVSRAPSVAIHLFATAMLAAAFRRRGAVLPAFAVVLGVHVAFDYWAPQIVPLLTGVDPVHGFVPHPAVH